MSEDLLREPSGERSLVSIVRNERGRTWRVTVRVGDDREQLLAAYEVARELDRLLVGEELPAKRGRGRSEEP